ncbi:substrate-binding periplasmic protein [Zooshikella ganghwensis]|nr:transporter substrate-binding domain-containing protein [Zooshikella ganghwensis]
MSHHYFFCIILLFHVGHLSASIVKICDDEIEFPPYTFFERDSQGTKTNLVGVTHDLLKEIFNHIDLTYKVDLVPWKRCIFEVEKYDTRKTYEMFSTGSYFLKRASKYYATAAYGVVNQGIFYSTQQHPDGINVNSIKDLQQFTQVCGVLGYSYRAYKLTDESKFMRAPSIVAGLKMLGSNRCQIMPLGIEVAQGVQLIEQYRIPKTIKVIRINAIKPTTFHLYISKSSPRAFEIYTKVNQQLVRMIHTGEVDKIHQKYADLLN